MKYLTLIPGYLEGYQEVEKEWSLRNERLLLISELERQKEVIKAADPSWVHPYAKS